MFQIAKHGHTVNRDHDVFISDYIHGIHEESVQNNCDLEISTYRNKNISEIISSVNSSSIDGAIFLGTELSSEDVQLLGSVSIPVVFIDTFYEFLNFPFVDMDNIDSVFKILSSFYKNGHREIGMIRTPVLVNNFHLREIGFRKGLKELGLSYKNEYVYSVDSTFDGAYKDMSNILNHSPKLPTAIFAANDIMAYGCIKAIEEHGIKIPQDLSIIGFDDLPLSSVMKPALTTMQVSKNEIGRISFFLLQDLLKNKENAHIKKVLINGELISRESVQKISFP